MRRSKLLAPALAAALAGPLASPGTAFAAQPVAGEPPSTTISFLGWKICIGPVEADAACNLRLPLPNGQTDAGAARPGSASLAAKTELPQERVAHPGPSIFETLLERVRNGLDRVAAQLAKVEKGNSSLQDSAIQSAEEQG